MGSTIKGKCHKPRYKAGLGKLLAKPFKLYPYVLPLAV